MPPPRVVDVTLLSFCLAAELLLLGTHAKVLLALGQPYRQEQLASKRWSYFLVDALSPWLSLSALSLSQPPAHFGTLVLLALGHASLHAFYIATFETRHGKRVLAMSAVPDTRSRCVDGYPSNAHTGVRRGGGPRGRCQPPVHVSH
jgi:hypothetical protein